MNETPAYWLFVCASLVNLTSAAIGNVFGAENVDRLILFAIASGVLALVAKRSGNNG